ncbi:MAG: hypothetical protein V7K33_10955 [Nostoc sp.]
MFRRVRYGDAKITNEFAKITNEFAEITNEFAEITNEFAEITNEFAEITNEFTEITNEFTEITNEFTEITNEFAEITNEFAKITNKFAEITNALASKNRRHRHDCNNLTLTRERNAPFSRQETLRVACFPVGVRVTLLRRSKRSCSVSLAEPLVEKRSHAEGFTLR